MIQRLSQTTVYVYDQDEALKFYRDKLGFEVSTDSTMDSGFRWVTVGPKLQPDFEIALMKLAEGPMCDAATCATLKELVKKGVEFMGPPVERFYGIEAIGKDNSGNWFSMTQRLK